MKFPETTEMLLISLRYCKVDSSNFTLDISGTEIKPSSAVRNIGAIFDSCMLLESHVNQICRSSYYNIRNFGAIRKYLSPSTAAHYMTLFAKSVRPMYIFIT